MPRTSLHRLAVRNRTQPSSLILLSIFASPIKMCNGWCSQSLHGSRGTNADYMSLRYRLFCYSCMRTSNGVLTAHAGWLSGVQLRHFSPTCAVHIEACGGCWLSGCRSSVEEHWLYKPGVLGLISGGFRLFRFHLFLPHNI